MDTEGVLLRFDGLFRRVQEEMEEDKETIETVNILMVVVSTRTLIMIIISPHVQRQLTAGSLYCWRPSSNNFFNPQSPTFCVAKGGKPLRLCRANARDHRDVLRGYPFGFPSTQSQRL